MKLNFLRRLGALLLALALVLPMAVTSAWAAEPAKRASLDKYVLNLDTGSNKSDTLHVLNGRAGATTWSSSDERVATVKNGAVTAVGRGHAKITATNYNLVCDVWVDAALVAAQTITLDAAPNRITNGSLELDVSGAGATLTASVYPNPEYQCVGELSWVSSDESVVRIDRTANTVATLTPTGVGAASVTVSSSGISAVVNVTVKAGVQSIQFAEPSVTMKSTDFGGMDLHLIFNPSNATNQAVTWTSSNTKVVEVNQNGHIWPVGPGSTTVRVRSQDNSLVTAMCTVTVIDAETPVLEITPETVPSLVIGETFQLNVSRFEGDGASLTWASSSPKVASVSQNGLITCLAKGRTTITATAVGRNGKKAEVKRTVNVVDPSSLNATSMSAKGPTSVTVSAGGEAQLAVNVSPSSAYVTWTSDNLAVATVDPVSGKVTGISPGRANITATAQKADGALLTVVFQVAVMGKVTGISFVTNSEVLGVGEDMYTQFDDGQGRSRTVSVRVASEYDTPTNTYVVWESSDPNLVSVTAKTPTTTAELTISSARTAGSAVITATVYDSSTQKPMMIDEKTPYSAKLKAIVSGLTLSASEMTMYTGESKSLTMANRYGAVSEGSALEWRSSDSSIVSAEGGGTGATLNAWNKGTATITASTVNGKYSATCKVTVTEDPGTVIKAGSAAAGNSVSLGTSSIISQLNAMAQKKTKANMEYISSIFISPNQGVVYNTYTSEADTGAGVSMSEKYYVNRSTPAAEAVGALSFVPNKSFNGEARITFLGYSQGQALSGVLSVNVAGQGQGGSDVTYTTNAVPITFQADDFNVICKNRTGRSLKYVTFTPPSASQGSLYENYTNEAHPGAKVVSTTQYNRAGTPSINSVTFVPASGFGGTVSIPYRAVDSSNAVYSGTVTVRVNRNAASNDPADVSYTAAVNGVTFRTADFSSACSRVMGQTLSHVRFTLPPTSDGTLLYNYRGFGSYDSAVSASTSYYTSGSPALSGVTFVPAETSSGRTAIPYTGYTTSGASYTGTVYITESGWMGATNQTYDYTVSCGSAANFTAAAFNAASRAATGYDLSYIRFNSLPPIGAGTLFYTTGANSRFQNADTKTQFYRTSPSSNTPLVGNVVFQTNSTYTGVVKIPFTGWDINGASFTAEVSVNVTPITIYCAGTTASPIPLTAQRVRSALSGVFSAPLDYIEFTSLPNASTGRLYAEYKGYGTGYAIQTGTKYYPSGIDQMSFVAKGRYTGDTTASYVAYSTSGEKMNGDIVFAISNAAGSDYFTDMDTHLWAASSVDYLYDNKVTNGMTATTFGPYQNILRRDFVLMLYRIYNFPGGSVSNTGFNDVRSDAYYAMAVSAAKASGIIPGDSASFRPNEPIIREDAMVMMVNAMKAAGTYRGSASTSVLNSFPDSGQVSNYAREAVSILVSLGAVTGDNGKLNPRSSITRSEAAVLLHFIMTQ